MNFDDLIKRAEALELLRFTTLGSVDDGKSTLIGRLLSDCSMVYQDHMESLAKDSKKWGTQGENLEFALLLDGLKAEREQGITIDVAYRYFSTPKRKFIIADNPGHVQYTRNMATGASTSNLAVILIDAVNGVTTQSKRHCFIASLLGIRHLVIAVNKMDLTGWSEEVFENVKKAFTEFTAKLNLYDVRFIPVSALFGDNVAFKSKNMDWYTGDTLLDCLETVHIASDMNLIDLRFPVQYVLHPSRDFRGFSGSVVSGIVRKGDEIAVLPSGKRSRVKSIVTFDGDLEEVYAPMAVTLVLDDEIDISRGDMIVHVKNLPAIAESFEAVVVWMSDIPLETGKSYLFKHTTNLVQGTISELRYVFDVDKIRRKYSASLGINDIGRVQIKLNRPIFLDDYSKNRATGSFIIIDRLTNATIGAGMINERHLSLQLSETAQKTPYDSENASIPEKVTPHDREMKYKQKPAIVLIYGCDVSFSSSVGSCLERLLFDRGCLAFMIDKGATEKCAVEKAINEGNILSVAEALYSAGMIVVLTCGTSEYTLPVGLEQFRVYKAFMTKGNSEYSLNFISPEGETLYTALSEEFPVESGKNNHTAVIMAENIYSAMIESKIIG